MSPFYVGKFEVTQEQYEAIKGENSSSFSAAGEAKEKIANLDTRKFPVEMVSWEEANEYCKALEAKTGKKFKLIKEVEWEYACRAGSTTAFHFGPELNGRQANCNGGYPFGTTTTGPCLAALARLVLTRRTHWGCTTCTATSGNGARRSSRIDRFGPVRSVRELEQHRPGLPRGESPVGGGQQPAQQRGLPRCDGSFGEVISRTIVQKCGNVAFG